MLPRDVVLYPFLEITVQALSIGQLYKSSGHGEVPLKMYHICFLELASHCLTIVRERRAWRAVEGTISICILRMSSLWLVMQEAKRSLTVFRVVKKTSHLFYKSCSTCGQLINAGDVPSFREFHY